MTFDPTKPVQTRDGQEVEILRSDLKCAEPIVSVITKRDGEQSIFRHSEGGHFFEDKSESSLDLINIPEKLVAVIGHNLATDKYTVQVGPENTHIKWEHGSNFEVIAQVLFEKGDGLPEMRP